MALAKLTVCVPSPGVNLAESGAGDRVPEPALNLINSLTSFFKAGDKLRDVVGVYVAETQLPV